MFTDEGEVVEAMVGALKLALHSLGFAFLLVSFLKLRLVRNEDGKGPSMKWVHLTYLHCCCRLDSQATICHGKLMRPTSEPVIQ